MRASRIKVWTHIQLCHMWGCKRKMGWGGGGGKQGEKMLHVQREWQRWNAGNGTLQLAFFSCFLQRKLAPLVHIHSTSIYGGLALFWSLCQVLWLHRSCLEPAESWQQTEFKSSDSNEGMEDDYVMGLKNPIGADGEAAGEWWGQEIAPTSMPEGVKEGKVFPESLRMTSLVAQW